MEIDKKETINKNKKRKEKNEEQEVIEEVFKKNDRQHTEIIKKQGGRFLHQPRKRES